jgi:hypothetical protein
MLRFPVTVNFSHQRIGPRPSRCQTDNHRSNGRALLDRSVHRSQADHTILVVVAFTDHTEWSVTLNSIPVAAVSLYAPGDGDRSRQGQPLEHLRALRVLRWYNHVG